MSGYSLDKIRAEAIFYVGKFRKHDGNGKKNSTEC